MTCSGTSEAGRRYPVRIITHQMPLEDAAEGYDIVKHERNNCEVVLKA